MSNRISRSLALALTALVLGAATTSAIAQPNGVDPQATAVLRRMTDYLASLQRFKVDTQSSLDVVLTSGQKIEFNHAASATVQRPNRLRAERKGDGVDEVFYYDGKSLSLHNPAARYYATVAAPDTLDAALDFGRTSLDITAPASDLLYKNAFDLLTQDLSAGFIVGKSFVGGVSTTHLAFRGPEVDFQVWVQDGDKPLPRKYVITSKLVAGMPEFTVTMDHWNTAPTVNEAMFHFAPPAGARVIEFVKLPAALK